MMTPPDGRAAAISDAVKEVLSDGATVAPSRRPIPAKFNRQRTVKTILTKFARLEEYDAELGLEPFDYLDIFQAEIDERRAATLYQQAFENGEESIKMGVSLGGGSVVFDTPNVRRRAAFPVNSII
jgi:hypothetical protein